MKAFGQNREDIYIYNTFFRNQSDGFYIDVGAHDGITISNSILFERLGWDGICIEAHPTYYEKLLTHRNCTCIFAAAGNEDSEEVTFYLNQGGGLSSLDKNMENVWREQHRPRFKGYNETAQVPMMTLNTILKEYSAPKIIDYVTIDVEGCEMLVLEGIDLTEYHVKVFIVEVIRGLKDKRDALDKYMINNNYKYVTTLGIENHIYYKPIGSI